MAVVDNITRKEITGLLGIEVVRAQLTGATSTFVSKFGTVVAVGINVEGTNGATWTRSGSTITITGTNDDWVNIFVFGR